MLTVFEQIGLSEFKKENVESSAPIRGDYGVAEVINVVDSVNVHAFQRELAEL